MLIYDYRTKIISEGIAARRRSLAKQQIQSGINWVGASPVLNTVSERSKTKPPVKRAT